MPTKRLPSNPSLEHLKYQARDLLKAQRARDPEACQRIREFHPRFAGSSDAAIGEAKLTLSDAQLAVAREHGFASWARLKSHVERPNRADLDLPQHERIDDTAFRRAVDLLDAGDAEGLRAHLAAHPDLVRRRVVFEGGNYFTNPTLLEFVAENPIRRGSLPPNVVEVARVVLDAGADRASVEGTLMLVCSGQVSRECGVQVPLIDLLCDYGAGPDSAMFAALGHGEFEAVDVLIRRGARVDLTVAAATGRVRDAGRLLPAAGGEARHRALALAAQFGHAEIVRLLLDAGEDPNRYNPVGCHSHSTPLHQAALAGHEEVVRLLVERGARLEVRDIHFHGTPLGWAEYAGRAEVAAYLRARGAHDERRFEYRQ
jgi:hypothetical protein